MAGNLAGAGEGAGAGASAGYSVGGPWGAVAGAVIGGAIGGIEGTGNAIPPPTGPLGGLSKVEYDWWKTNIQPLQQQSYDSLFGQNVVKNAVTQAQGDVNTQFDRLPAAYQRQMSSLGITPSASQQQSFTKQSALNRGIAQAGASNATRGAIATQRNRYLGT